MVRQRRTAEYQRPSCYSTCVHFIVQKLKSCKDEDPANPESVRGLGFGAEMISSFLVAGRDDFHVVPLRFPNGDDVEVVPTSC